MGKIDCLEVLDVLLVPFQGDSLLEVAVPTFDGVRLDVAVRLRQLEQ